MHLADGDMSVKLSCVVLNAVSMNCHWSAVDTSQATTNYQMFFNAKLVVTSPFQ